MSENKKRLQLVVASCNTTNHFALNIIIFICLVFLLKYKYF
ncbi:hypothetical protein PROSTU_03945 [Providencia stuartii ATCC 25827]|uniref:Uncharacterized protein n=1 Tax=Providencia stuartii ATCC 25827 TaxID=471874 RepID=A0AA86YGH6_PROST|nr:hypothetical protein PROSTU_03945 [Providencia stuartii ATCC 25827]